MIVTYDLVRIESWQLEGKEIQMNMTEENMRLTAKVWGFKIARVNKLVNHTSKKYNHIDCKGYSIIKKFSE